MAAPNGGAAAAGPSEILPDKGLVYTESKELQPVLCKPKLLPIKSFSLERLERLEKKLEAENKARREAAKAQRKATGWNTTASTASPVAPVISSASKGPSERTPSVVHVIADPQSA